MAPSLTTPINPPLATLILENGTVFQGTAIGARGHAIGEMVFNLSRGEFPAACGEIVLPISPINTPLLAAGLFITSMVGYQEILTDPSYAGQMITFTCSHIGNVGVNPQDQESDKVWAAGMICRSFTQVPSNWRATQSLDGFLKDHNVVGISDIDTRALVQMLRTEGALGRSIQGCIISDDLSMDQALALMKNSKDERQNFVEKVSAKSKYILRAACPKYHIVVYDFGVKHSILESLRKLGCTLMVVPWNTSAEAVLDLNPDGILLSNGPGDPSQCTEAIAATKIFLVHNIPTFGICLGHQILALACGARIFKLSFGHHGSNHPVMDMKTQRACITSQNHNYAVDSNALPPCLDVTHISLFDQTIQGIRHRYRPAMGLQGHPEASPGPHDMGYMFQQFVGLVLAQARIQKDNYD